jgi:hypothetical protein
VYPDRDVDTVLDAARHRVDVALQPDGEPVVSVRRTGPPADDSVLEVPSRA